MKLLIIMTMLNLAWSQGNGNVTSVSFINSPNLTMDQIESRTESEAIIEVLHGTVTDAELNGETENGWYISYTRLDFPVTVGDAITTYCLYNTETTWCDDIIERYDCPTNAN